MSNENCYLNMEGPHPLLVLPKVCTTLETNSELSENMFINLNISSKDAEGSHNVIYNGFCNVKVVEVNDIDVSFNKSNDSSNENMEIILPEANQLTFPTYSDSEVWIDPSTSPYVYNQCETPPLISYTITEGTDDHITIEHHNTYITQNVYNCSDTARYSPISDDQITVEEVREAVQNLNSYNMYAEDELECGVILSQLSKEVLHEKETQEMNRKKFEELDTDNNALKQLMSTGIQSVSKQQKIILYLGQDSESAHTIQNISINDPMLECADMSYVDDEFAVDDTNRSSRNLRSKKYQCNKCKQIFNLLGDFKQHMVGSHRYDCDMRYICTECGKKLKNQQKFEQHCLAHGDPDFECNKCRKVFATKFTLRNHLKIHSRKFPCTYCTKSFTTGSQLNSHTTKCHSIFMCESRPILSDNSDAMIWPQSIHKSENNQSLDNDSEPDFPESLLETDDTSTVEKVICEDDKQEEDNLVLAKLMSDNKLFRTGGRNNEKRSKYNKVCDVCHKQFDRIGDLKRHLIEHAIRNTLAKNPVNKYGVLNICCEICPASFSKVDKYKAHLREHAKLTLYKCTFCDKSFSDSSNFSKHKKVHGTSFYQCDICQRKFNSKKMIIQHMVYHNNNRPLHCQFCDKTFYFQSALNKHINCAHIKEIKNKFRCKFCRDCFPSLKEKWDHEWLIHSVRKAIVDCLICGSRFRKYAELKRHCTELHDTTIPAAKRLLKWKQKRYM